MKNYFIIHGSFGSSNEHYLPWLKAKLEETGAEVISPNFPIGVGVQTFESWSKILDKYKDKITSQTVFVGRSIAPIFIVHYLLNNNIKIDTLISISGFNGTIGESDYDKVNSTFFMKDFKRFKNLANKRICFMSKNDPYVPLKLLDEFSKEIDAEVIMRENAGHFNTDSGYNTFEELLELIKNK